MGVYVHLISSVMKEFFLVLHSTLVSMLELSPPLPELLLRVGGLSRLNTQALELLNSVFIYLFMKHKDVKKKK
jgi:hypothetical protein